MSDVQQMELEAIRRELDQLAKRVQALESAEERSAGDNIPAVLQGLVSEEMEKKGKSSGIAVLRGVIMRGPGGTATHVGRTTLTEPSELPSEEQLRERAAALGINLLVLRTLRHLAERFLNGASLRVTPAELATALGVEAAALHSALTPLIAREWLRWAKTASGEECYEYLSNDTTLVLLLLG